MNDTVTEVETAGTDSVGEEETTTETENNPTQVDETTETDLV